MNNQYSLFQPEDLCEYFFVISPDNKIKSHVKFLKNKLHTEIQLDEMNIHSIAHVSLFKCRFGNELPVSNDLLDYSLKDIRPFIINLDGSEIFKHGEIKRSIVLKITEPEPINEIINSLTLLLGLNARFIRPHITVAKEITVYDLKKIVLTEYNYKASFACNKVTILRRLLKGNRKSKYEVLHNIPLKLS